MSQVRVTDKIKINTEAVAASTAGSTSMMYDMSNYHKAAFSVALTAAGHLGTAVIDLMESSNATVAGTSAAGGSVGITIGGAGTLVESSVSGVQKMTLTMSSATSNQYFTLNLGTVQRKFQYSTSTALNTATADVSTLSYYGSTVGSTVNTGIALSIDRLKTAITSTVNFGSDILCSTGTTANIILEVAGDKGALGFQDSTGVMAATIQRAVGGFNLGGDELTSTANKRYAGVKVSTKATAAAAGVSIVRTGGRYNPPDFSGRLGT